MYYCNKFEIHVTDWTKDYFKIDRYKPISF